ncbi:DNA binding domain-containing protein, excisionase family [Capnocytophaga haemolytica]|jgi:DNA binding domain, excisionase family|uniref:DNA binding domain, excisionase family n=1 Tax=Capnocytophaga haemolytica TaxID=45243 RepID=A0AAX2GVL8_9FLAO|nr:helix-turn-helix domain-containing protein [Capnocytophaga haemolytica]AMD85090.1 hypothetical protein AXF12_05885 [Capnocytophaga haemolytica]SFN68595.1 DNA binding domain-containing protein, excisionase family [Capnocytophaga haemolytica]SNV05101.1 DNA binding domain, excisionase family [Capnocytophaga haemolytica]
MRTVVQRLVEEIDTLHHSERVALFKELGVVPDSTDIIANALEIVERRRLQSQLMGTAEAAKYLNVTAATIRKWYEMNKLKNVNPKKGGHPKFAVADLDAFKEHKKTA